MGTVVVQHSLLEDGSFGMKQLEKCARDRVLNNFELDQTWWQGGTGERGLQ